MTQGPYHLFFIGVLLILSYLFSLLSVRLQLITTTGHRRFWNTLLLLFFLSTSILGVILAVKVNYKLEIPWVERALKWHVDLGIGFTSVSLFHLSWHLGYFKKIVTRSATDTPGKKLTPHLTFTTFQVRLAFILLGFISMMAQLVMLREFIKALHGNELVIGIYLAVWMILTAAGAWAGSGYKARISRSSVLRILLILSCTPLMIYILLILVNRYIFLPGFEPGMLSSITYILLLLGVFTLVSGFLFSYISRAVKEGRTDASFYMLDSAGSLAGGFLFGLILVLFLDNIQVLALLWLITVFVLILIYGYPSKKVLKPLLGISSVLLFALFLLPGVRNGIESLRYKNETILGTRDTPYGNLTFTSKEGQITGYLDRNPVLSTADVARAEESVHYPALQHPNPDAFLLLGGGLSGKAEEIIKYKPALFDYCEADPGIYEMGTRYIPETRNLPFHFIPMDGRTWLARSDSVMYDVIISSAGDPLTIGWNRYFTREFYQQVRSRLGEGGIFCMQLSSGGNYVSVEGSQLLSINYHTLKQVFEHVLLVPGYATYFLASDKSLSLDFPSLLEDRDIETVYVHPDYLDVTRITFDSDQLMERLTLDIRKTNSDLWPRLFFSSLANFESRMGSRSLVITGILGILLFFILFFSYRSVKTGMFVAGFTGAGIQILLIIVVQSFYGYAYKVAPLLITIFMAGIVAGTKLWKIIWYTPSPSKYTGLIWIMAIASAACVIVLKTEQLFVHRITGQLILGILNLIPGILVGSVYGMSLAISKNEGSSAIGRIYSADLAGAALGTFLPVIFILPLIGVTNTFILFCGINVSAGLYILSRWR